MHDRRLIAKRPVKRGLLARLGLGDAQTAIESAAAFFGANPGASQQAAYQYLINNTDESDADIQAAVAAVAPAFPAAGQTAAATREQTYGISGGGAIDTPSAGDQVLSSITDIGKSLFSSAAQVGTAAAPGLIQYGLNRGAQQIGAQSFLAPRPATPAPASSSIPWTPILVGGGAILAVLALVAVSKK